MNDAYVTDFVVSCKMTENDDWSEVPGSFKGTDKGITNHIFDIPILARCVRIYPRKAEKHVSLRCDVLLAVQMADTAEQNRKYSSVLNQRRSQSTIESTVCWTAGVQDANQWIRLDLGAKPQTVAGTVIAASADGCGQWVTSYKVSSTADNIIWQEIPGIYPADGQGLCQATFPSPVVAKYLTLFPLEWNKAISMRAEAIIAPGMTRMTPTATY